MSRKREEIQEALKRANNLNAGFDIGFSEGFDSPTKVIDEIEGIYRRPSKEFTQDEIDVLREANIEIDLLNEIGKDSCYFFKGKTRTRVWKESAIDYYKNHPNQFKLIPLEDLKDNSFFNSLSNLHKTQFIRNLRAKLVQKIFKRKGLRKFGVQKINNKIKELRKNK